MIHYLETTRSPPQVKCELFYSSKFTATASKIIKKIPRIKMGHDCPHYDEGWIVFIAVILLFLIIAFFIVLAVTYVVLSIFSGTLWRAVLESTLLVLFV